MCQLIVMTGLSGSGKSSLAFDTIYAEGQRRYVESLSAYARQFFEILFLYHGLDISVFLPLHIVILNNHKFQLPLQQ